MEVTSHRDNKILAEKLRLLYRGNFAVPANFIISSVTGSSFGGTIAGPINFVKAGSVLGQRYGKQSQGTGRMPGFGNLLTDAQIKAIVEYVRGL